MKWVFLVAIILISTGIGILSSNIGAGILCFGILLVIWAWGVCFDRT